METSLDIKELEHYMRECTRTLGRETRIAEPFSIGRVFHLVRRDHESAYEPKLISIGPFHRNKEALKPMETLKWKYLRHLTERSPRRNTIENYLGLVYEFKNEARNYYSELPAELNDRALVEMMVLDGCFLIEFLVKCYMGENLGVLNAVNWNLSLMRSDLLLLENQLPFPILELLFDISDIPELCGMKEDGTNVTIMDLAVCFVTKNKHDTLPEALRPDNVRHLLHLYHASLLPISTSNQDQPKRLMACAPFLWPLFSVFYCKIPFKCSWDSRTRHAIREKKPRAPMEIPTATQLRDCGVNFETNEKASSFLEVTFDKEVGAMKIPKLPMYGNTIYHIHNLVAFEQSHPEMGTMFTSYAMLMDMLVDTPDDVAILKSSHILQGNNEEVAKLYNTLSNGAYLDFDTHYHNKLFRDVREYCTVARHKWRARFMHDYFENPWSVISLIAAVVLLILTFLSTFYAMLAYYRPPS